MKIYVRLQLPTFLTLIGHSFFEIYGFDASVVFHTQLGFRFSPVSTEHFWYIMPQVEGAHVTGLSEKDFLRLHETLRQAMESPETMFNYKIFKKYKVIQTLILYKFIINGPENAGGEGGQLLLRCTPLSLFESCLSLASQ